MSAEKVDELSVIVNKLSEKIDAINTKIDTLAPVPRRAEAHNETVGPDPSLSSNVNQRKNPELDLDPDLSAASPVDVSQEFELVRDRLSKVSIPTQYRVHDSSAGIKQDCKPTLKVVSKCARFAETGLKQLSLITPDADGVCHINQGDLQALFTIFAAQNAYLKGEYSNLVNFQPCQHVLGLHQISPHEEVSRDAATAPLVSGTETHNEATIRPTHRISRFVERTPLTTRPRSGHVLIGWLTSS
ncbi:hypothetical protein ElyMa_000367700 [Elysia marginata]|uniref:Uncharacterized protein n=1 Tax=Elysia marginata TaxID=1093978 RepID=A0AAV4FG26_9GAST|nr:hypothetical protein ElyMa_000367700 [Elysia marginata]